MNSPISAEIADTKSDERFEEALHKLRQMGSRFDLEVLEATRKLFVPIIADQPWMSRKATRDIPYADDARRLLDIYPADQSKAPLVLFVHGGGFVAGAKDVAPPFNCNVGAYFAHHGYCAVLMNYRLAPQYTWPGAAQDIARVMDWLTLHAESYGADADRVFLLGQSAGATHALSYLFDPVIDPRHRDRVQAAALMSGTYLMDDKAGPGARAYFGEDADLWDERSPGRHVTASHLPLLLSIAEYDTAVTVEKTLDFASLLKRFGPPPRVERLADCNHVSTLYGLGLGTDVVGKTLRRFFS